MRIAISGIGAVSGFGVGAATLRIALREGRDGIGPVRHFDTTPFASHVAATVPGFDSEAQRKRAAFTFAQLAGKEALAQARAGGRLALVLGTSLGGGESPHHALAAQLATALGVTGPVIAITTACCSSSNAIGLGAELLEAGEADAVLVGGTDQIVPEMFAGFSLLGALCATRCAPFSLPTGLTLGEGAGFLVLERADAAAARGAKAIGFLRGEALSCDALHQTSPDENGRGLARCVGSALRQAGVEPAAVDYVNAHGTGTAHNDAAEWKGLTAALGRESVLVSSTKGAIGHAQGAAGALEVISTLVCLEDGTVPPTRNFTGPRNRCPADPVAQFTPRPARVETWLADNSAFWGANAALVFSRTGGAGPTRAPRRLVIAGFGAARGTKATAFTLPRLDLAPLDLPSRLVTRAVAEALGELGPVVKGERRDELGLFVATLGPSLEAQKAFAESIRDRGLARLSADAFTHMVATAIGGSCARLLGLRGPFTTLTSGAGSGLVALGCAARYLQLHDEVRGIVVVGVDDEPKPGLPSRAVAVLLAREGALPMGGPVLEVALAGGRRVDDALAAVGGAAADVREDPSVCGSLESLGAAVAGLRSARGSRVVAQGLGNTTCAARVTAADPALEEP